MKKVIYSALLFSSVLIACKSTAPSETSSTKPAEKPAAANCASSTVTYEADIKGILETNCTGCHGKRAAGGYDFTNLADVQRAANKGELVGTIKWQAGFPKMPARAGQLDQATIAKIECWVANGMK